MLRDMTGNKDQLEDFEEFNGGSVTFGGSKGYISGKEKIRVGNLDFDSVAFIKELGHFNLFSISKICDKQHKVPRHHNMYSFDMKTPSLTKDYACLIAKATCDESKLWHRRNDHTCVACHKEKQHRASCKAKSERLITEPLHTLHIDLFGPSDSIRVSVPSLDRGRREGKAPMTEEEETQASRNTKEQILQEEAGLAEAIRLDALEKALE
ncbi:hypothetical protein Tco_0096434, partial [Tanacetum coccineum]